MKRKAKTKEIGPIELIILILLLLGSLYGMYKAMDNWEKVEDYSPYCPEKLTYIYGTECCHVCGKDIKTGTEMVKDLSGIYGLVYFCPKCWNSYYAKNKTFELKEENNDKK